MESRPRLSTGADPSDLPIEEVRDVFLTLSKALRAYQLYDPNNPVYKRFLANLGEALDRVWETRDLLQALIEEDRFTWMGEEVYRNETRADSLAFMFYRDGVRGLTFKQGIEEQEIEDLLEVLHRARKPSGGGGRSRDNALGSRHRPLLLFGGGGWWRGPRHGPRRIG